MKSIIKLICTLVMCGWSLIASATVISVRLIKAAPSRCTAKPTLKLLSEGNQYRVVNKPWYNGENDWEIYFEIETANCSLLLAKLEIIAPGVKISRALVGKTDVAFRQSGDTYQFQMVPDTLDGRHVFTTYFNPKGGAPIAFYHNWKARVNGDYLNVPYPEKALAASFNYAMACQEMLRLMGDMSGLNQKFYGEFQLITCESSSPRGHTDFPPHWHLEHWEHAYNEYHGIDYRKKQYYIPHYYLDSAGRIVLNKTSLTRNYQKVNLPKNTFAPGDTCTWKDVEGHLIFKQVLKAGGVEFIRTEGPNWSLRPDSAEGGNTYVWIYRGNEPQARVKAVDDGERGLTTIEIIHFKNGKQADTWTDRFSYDRFTGVKLKTDRQ